MTEVVPAARLGPPGRADGSRGSGGSPPRSCAVSDVLAALETVRDPELDEPITSLGFVTSAAVSADGDAQVRLRLPTYFCAPNFAFLMVADAYDAVSALKGLRRTRVVLEDHFAGEAINNGVAARGELAGLRADFLRKAVLAGTDLVCRPLVQAGATPDQLTAMALGDPPPSRELGRLRQRRAELGLPADDRSPLVIDPLTGAGVTAESLPLHMRMARTTRISVQANTGICRGMLRHRYASAGIGEEESA